MASNNPHIHHKSCNHSEHKQWNRRSFLQALGLVGGGTMAFANTALSAAQPTSLSQPLLDLDNDRILVLIRLKGGNDGLNTIIPLYDYDTYRNARPTIGFKENQITKLSDNFGIPNYAKGFERMWGEGQMKVAHGIGYENNSLSHFTGSDIWASTDETDTELTGWMGRYFEELYPNFLLETPEKPAAIQIGSNGNQIFDGTQNNFAFSVSNPERLYEIAKNGEIYDLSKTPGGLHGEQLRYLKGEANTTFAYAGVINDAYTSSSDYAGYEDNVLARQLSVVSRLIKGNLGTRVFMVTLGGFDTHDDQTNRHTELITNLSKTVSHFFEDLKGAGWDDKVLAMTISEFGRRVDENGSNGTDHGAASPSMFFGPALEGNGFIGNHPSLSALDKTGNLSYTTDFRELYATVLKEWLCVDASLVDEALLGKQYDTVPLGFRCSDNTLSTDSISVLNNLDLKHTVLYQENEIVLELKNGGARHVAIEIFNMLGQKIFTLKNEMLFEKTYAFPIKEVSGQRLESGQYIYSIEASGKTISSRFIIP